MNIINLPRKLASKPLIVIGSCYQDDQKVGVISSEPRGVDGSAGIAYMSVGNGLSDWILNDGPATCKADLRYDDNKGQHIVASTTMDVLGFRAQMQINQPTPVNMTDKVSFTISNLPDSVPKSSLQIHFYCDIPETGRRSTVGSTTSVYTDAGTPALVSIHSPVFKWTPTGQVTTCYSLLTQFPITLFDGITASSQNWASSKFQVKLQ